MEFTTRQDTMSSGELAHIMDHVEFKRRRPLTPSEFLEAVAIIASYPVIHLDDAYRNGYMAKD